MQFRYYDGLELRTEGDRSFVDGWLVRYDDIYKAKRFSESIKRGAFKFQDRMEVNIQHDRSRIIGAYPDSVETNARDEGVEVSVRLPRTQDGRDTIELLNEGILKGFSSEFIPTRMKRTKRHVDVISADLYGMALVGSPAYKKSTASLRSIVESLEDEYEDEPGRDQGIVRFRSQVRLW